MASSREGLIRIDGQPAGALVETPKISANDALGLLLATYADCVGAAEIVAFEAGGASA
jgi:hypothetical protein